MILYHFCPAHLLDGIRKNGLTLGAFPLIDEKHTKLIKGLQWLTKEPDTSKQSWATRERVFYSRTAYRLTVDIPLNRTRKLMRATAFVEDFKPVYQKVVTEWEGHESWFIYRGDIPKKWIKKIERMEGEI
jgi:hypothetical protein